MQFTVELNFVYSWSEAVYGKVKRYDNGAAFLWGFFNNYDFLENNVYQIGSVSIGPGVGYRTPPKKSLQYIGVINAALAPMGAANSVYAEDFDVAFLDSARTYNMGMGMSGKFEAFLNMDIGNLYIGSLLYWIHTMQGAPGDEFIGIIKPRLSLSITLKII